MKYHNDASLRRFLRAFLKVDEAFQAIIKSNKWRKEYGVAEIKEDNEVVRKYKERNIALIMKHRDMEGRFVISSIINLFYSCWKITSFFKTSKLVI